MDNKTRKIRAAIRRDPHVREICELLGVTMEEFLDGIGASKVKREGREEDLVENNYSARALTAVGR